MDPDYGVGLPAWVRLSVGTGEGHCIVCFSTAVIVEGEDGMTKCNLFTGISILERLNRIICGTGGVRSGAGTFGPAFSSFFQRAGQDSSRLCPELPEQDPVSDGPSIPAEGLRAHRHFRYGIRDAVRPAC